MVRKFLLASALTILAIAAFPGDASAQYSNPPPPVAPDAAAGQYPCYYVRGTGTEYYTVRYRSRCGGSYYRTYASRYPYDYGPYASYESARTVWQWCRDRGLPANIVERDRTPRD